jgi:putative glutamine amidotransferase
MASGAAPLIGVTTYREEAAWGPWRTTAALVPDSYVECVARAGGRPVLLPVTVGSGSDEAAVEVVAALDALVLVGGGDLDPATYGAPARAATGGVSRPRDDTETALLAAALASEVPVLAICRGLQVLNVQRGGTLVQHVPDVVGHTGHRPAAGSFGPTGIRIEPGSCLAKIMGESDTVSCSHHQAIDELGSGLVVTARAPDGIVEAVEMPAASFVVGVQWHPEEDGDVRLFEALVDATR